MKLHIAMNDHIKILVNSTEPLDLARPDSPTIPGFPALPKLRNDHRDRHPKRPGQSEWPKAIDGKGNDAKRATAPRCKYEPVTRATALDSHPPTEEECAWSNRLREQNRLRKEQAEAQAMRDLLRKDALTKQKELDLLLFGKVAKMGISHKTKTHSSSKGLMMRVGASLKVFFS